MLIYSSLAQIGQDTRGRQLNAAWFTAQIEKFKTRVKTDARRLRAGLQK